MTDALRRDSEKSIQINVVIENRNVPPQPFTIFVFQNNRWMINALRGNVFEGNFSVVP